MKAKKIKPKKGRVFWKCSVFDGKIDFEEWIVRSIQNRTFKPMTFRLVGTPLKTVVAYMVHKLKGVTWVKRSKRHFDWGWALNIPPSFRLKFYLDEDGLADGWKMPYTTKLQAARACLQFEKEMLAEHEKHLEHALTAEEVAETEEDITEYRKGVAALKRAITREQRKAKK